MAKEAGTGAGGGAPPVAPPPIVGIGASAGGIEALRELFSALPDDPGAAFVVILHLDPNHRSELPAILASRTSLQVEQVGDSPTPLAGHIYVIPPDRQLMIEDGHISARPFDQPRGHRAPIDVFFRSLARRSEPGYAVILSGGGSDGAIGVREIKEAGGFVLVQEPEEAAFPSMPEAAIATHAADVVLPTAELANRLVELLRNRDQTRPEALAAADEVLVARILGHLKVGLGHDFSSYKRSTVLRRILRRVQVTRSGSLAEYAERVKTSEEEARALLGELLIVVTSFFRDPSSFEALGRKAVPALFAAAGRERPIRVWVAGCATGEEAYSIGMLLLEECLQRGERPDIQVIASDLDARALAIGRDGTYLPAIEADVSEERLARFFVRESAGYRVRKELRELVLFAHHSVLKDPPFSHLGLVSCRNLLIYLDRSLQIEVLRTFHYALDPEGFLFLGSAETCDHPDGLFQAFDREARIYRSMRRADGAQPLPPRLLRTPRPTLTPPRANELLPAATLASQAAAHLEALERLAPPSLLVDDRQRVLHLSPSVGRYLEPAGGPMTSDVVELVRPEMRHELRMALHQAFEQGRTTLSIPILVRFDGSTRRVYFQVQPLPGEPEARVRRAVVYFVEGDAPAQLAGTEGETFAEPQAAEALRRVEDELRLTQGRLQSSREDSDAGTEELRVANEELQSINEEYRSTAEELETSKEELQSMNEELQTVNAELKSKVETVSRAHGDLQNLMAATDIGILFLDPGLRIKRFTPRLADVFSIVAGDLGRQITDLTHRLDYADFAADLRAVLRDLAPVQREVGSDDGRWYLVRIRPYRTLNEHIDGVVATFVDISERRRTEEELRASEQQSTQKARLIELSRSPLFIWDFDDGIIEWNRGCEELYGFARDAVIGKQKGEVLRSDIPGSSFAAMRRELLDKGSWRGEMIQTAENGSRLAVESRLELFEIGGRRLVLESTFDITERKRWERRQSQLLRELTHRVKNILAVVQAVSHLTVRNSGSIDEFVGRFDGRLRALADAHELLVARRWQGIEVEELARTQLAVYLSEAPDRVRLRGPRALIPPDLATPFGLVFHELATNAAKYGALSGDDGKVELTWEIEEHDGRRRLQVRWEEREGPRVETTAAQGSGRRLIESGIPGARVDLKMQHDGCVCTIEIDLAGDALDDTGA